MSQFEAAPPTQPVRLAGLFSRMIAFSLDLVFISLINLVLVIGTGLIMDFFFAGNFENFPTLQRIAQMIIASSQWLMGLSSTFFAFVYFIFFWAIAGFTPGKAMLGLRVIRSDGRPVSLGRAVLRLIGYLIAALPLFLGFIWILFDNRRQGWHDKIAGTYVIYMWRQNTYPLAARSPELGPGPKNSSTNP